MAQYLLALYYENRKPSAEEFQRLCVDVPALDTKMEDAGVFVFHGGTLPPETATVVRPSGGDFLITDGPYTETKEFLGGFWMLALLLLLHARRAARVNADGSLARLADQDRRRWDGDLVTEGQAIVRACVQRGHPGPYQIQAAINAVHSIAASLEGTDWRAILTLYDQLYALTPTPVVALNRAVALAEVRGAAVGLAAVDELRCPALDGYYLFHAARADLLGRLGRDDEAAAAYDVARSLTANPVEQAFLDSQLAAVRAPGAEP